MKIIMDKIGSESYANLDTAVNSFNHNIALSDTCYDLKLQWNFNLNGTDVFSDNALESVADQVKNMASKAKSNFIIYAKKLVNFFFGWLINFFKGVVDVKKNMASNYKKAQDYLKKLNNLEAKARGANQEQKIEITDNGNCIIVGLTVIQLVNEATKALSNALQQTSTTTNSGSGSDTSSRAFHMINMLNTGIGKLYATVANIDITKTNELISSLKSSQFKVESLFKSLDSQANTTLKNAQSNAANKNAANVKDDKDADKFTTSVSSGANKELESQYKQKLEATANYMNEPKKAEFTPADAFDELRNQLTLFIDMAKANNWDIEKSIVGVEKIRRGLEKEISKMSVDNANDKEVSALLTQVISVGNNVNQMKNNLGTVVKAVNKSMNSMFTDVVKLGSVVVKIGQTD